MQCLLHPRLDGSLITTLLTISCGPWRAYTIDSNKHAEVKTFWWHDAPNWRLLPECIGSMNTVLYQTPVKSTGWMDSIALQGDT